MLNTPPFKFIIASILVHGALVGLFILSNALDTSDILSLVDANPNGSVEMLFNNQTEEVKREIKKIIKKKIKAKREVVDLGELPAEDVDEEEQVHKISLDDLKAVSNLSPEWKAFLKSLQAEISKRQHYPYSAKRLRQTGKVLIQFDVYSNGLIKNVSIQKKSDYEKLDASALELIDSIPKVENFPKKTEKSEKISITVPIEYNL